MHVYAFVTKLNHSLRFFLDRGTKYDLILFSFIRYLNELVFVIIIVVIRDFLRSVSHQSSLSESH